MNRTIALDIGDSRIGVAISDPLGITAQPRPTIERGKGYFNALIEFIVENNVNKIVLGYPLELDGTVGDQAKKVEWFKDKMSKEEKLVDMDIILWDERFTTKQAEFVLQGSKLKNKEKSSALDKISAGLILQSYLESQI